MSHARRHVSCAAFAVALKELKKNSGTGVTIRFDYLEVGFNGPLCCLSFLAEDLIKSSMENNLPDQWTKSMLRRGYERADKKSSSKKKGQSLAEQMAKSRQEGGGV